MAWRKRERRRPTRLQQTRDWLVLALTVVASAIALGQFPSGHPVVPALSIWTSQHEAAPAKAIATSFRVDGTTTPLRGPTSLKYGSLYTLTGRTGTVDQTRVTGTVVLRGSWNREPWNALAKTATDSDGRFSIKMRIHHRGSLRLRLSTPDGYLATGTLRVT